MSNPTPAEIEALLESASGDVNEVIAGVKTLAASAAQWMERAQAAATEIERLKEQVEAQKVDGLRVQAMQNERDDAFRQRNKIASRCEEQYQEIAALARRNTTLANDLIQARAERNGGTDLVALERVRADLAKEIAAHLETKDALKTARGALETEQSITKDIDGAHSRAWRTLNDEMERAGVRNGRAMTLEEAATNVVAHARRLEESLARESELLASARQVAEDRRIELAKNTSGQAWPAMAVCGGVGGGGAGGGGATLVSNWKPLTLDDIRATFREEFDRVNEVDYMLARLDVVQKAGHVRPVREVLREELARIVRLHTAGARGDALAQQILDPEA